MSRLEPIQLCKKIHHLDLFSGIGGFALGLQMADKDFYQTISFCEINAYCAEVLEKNFSGTPICRDIRELNTSGSHENHELLGGEE